MLRCTGGKLETRTRSGKKQWYIRLYYTDDAVQGKGRYVNKYLQTGLVATKENRAIAEKMLLEQKEMYSPQGMDILFHQYCEEWLAKKKSTVEVTTYEGYAYKLAYITAYFRENPVKVAELKPETVQNFYFSLLQKKKSSPAQKNEVGLGNRSIKDIAVVLRSVVDDAYAMDYIRDPRIVDKIKRVKYPQRPETKEKKPYISVATMPVFLNAIKGHRLEIPFKIVLFYGLRREEICGLKWSSIRNGRIYIENTVVKMKTLVEKERTKTDASRRNHLLIPELISSLEDVRRRQMENRRLLGERYHESDYVFTWEDGRPYSPDFVTKSFKKIIRKTEGLDDRLRLHDLRASCVSIFINANVSPKAVQGWTGHEDFETMFNRYARDDETEEKKLADYMRSVMFGK